MCGSFSCGKALVYTFGLLRKRRGISWLTHWLLACQERAVLHGVIKMLNDEDAEWSVTSCNVSGLR
jgi:hypothetical protein